MNAEILKCPVCSTGYGEDCHPRNLRCGHTICSNCAERYVDCPTKCLECFLKESYRNVSDFSVNYPILRILSSPEGTEPLCDIKIPSILFEFCDSSSHYNEKWRCNKHDNPFSFLCCSCSLWICPDCIVFDHPFPPRGSCRKIGFDVAMKIMRNQMENMINDLLKDIENFRNIYEDELADMHKFCLYCCSCYRRTHDRLIQCTNGLLEEVNKNNELFVQNAKDEIEKLKMSVNLDTSPKDMASIATETLAYKDELRTNINEHEEEFQPVITSIHRHLRMTIKLLVEKVGTIYAQYQSDHGTKWAPVTLKNERLLLHSLRDSNPPSGGFIIPYEYIRRLVPEDSTTIFLEVGTEAETLGPVYIRLRNTSKPSAKQMVVMCSGEEGVSHRGTCFYKYDEKKHSIHGGDYENNNGSGGRPVVPGFDTSFHSSLNIKKFPGSLIADQFSTRFNIILQMNKGVFGHIGTVKEGLHLIRKLHKKVQSVTQIFINDCGLFLPMAVQEEEEAMND